MTKPTNDQDTGAAQQPRIEELKRVFHWQGCVLPDPDPSASPEAVRDIFSGTYPELATATTKGPEFRDGEMIYTFQPNAGVKG
ncbi:hypothetical protein CKO28_02595 [Rhodovibrio sodomensis]|uniref:PRTRC system protein C n=1 Tax=Rhodovibrio sodomensis TaxID=1088 RepID=A0ABS1D948_9PROT|nr:PRTRC system protein C [Rhodovibrio sodomensis]MBK1666931.1 hypothetical protein [Rhodovibrio sodomensis]